jgi:hypothetical protein
MALGGHSTASMALHYIDHASVEDVRLEVTENDKLIMTFTLASYRAEDLRVALGHVPNPDGSM